MRKLLRNAPLVLALLRLHDGSHAIDASLGIDERAVFLEEGRAWKEHVGKARGFVEENVLDHEAIEGTKRLFHVLRVGVALGQFTSQGICHSPHGKLGGAVVRLSGNPSKTEYT